MPITAEQIQRSVPNIEKLINQHPENEARIHIALLQKIGLTQNPKTYNDKYINIIVVKKLFKAKWQDENIVKALKNYHLDKKYIIELLLVVFGAFFLHEDFNCSYPIGSMQDNSKRKELSSEKKEKNISRIVKALIKANWDDDEIAALILKFEDGNLLVNVLEQIGWNDRRIVKALDDTKKGKFTILLYLKEAGWDDIRTVKAISENKWSDYNIVNEISKNIRWGDQRLIQALLTLSWDISRICSAFYYFWTGKRILEAFVEMPFDPKLFVSVAQILLQKGKIENDEIDDILSSDPLNSNSKKKSNILSQCKKDILSWETIEDLI